MVLGPPHLAPVRLTGLPDHVAGDRVGARRGGCGPADLQRRRADGDGRGAGRADRLERRGRYGWLGVRYPRPRSGTSSSSDADTARGRGRSSVAVGQAVDARRRARSRSSYSAAASSKPEVVACPVVLVSEYSSSAVVQAASSSGVVRVEARRRASRRPSDRRCRSGRRARWAAAHRGGAAPTARDAESAVDSPIVPAARRPSARRGDDVSCTSTPSDGSRMRRGGGPVLRTGQTRPRPRSPADAPPRGPTALRRRVTRS